MGSVKEGYATTLDLGDLNFEVNIENFASLDKFIKGYPEAVERGIYNGMKRFSKMLTAKLKENAINEGLGDTELMYNFETRFNGSTIELIINSEYAIYVEMGTGIVGEINPHPDPKKYDISWEYDVEGHGDDGWKYLDDKNKLRWTKGQPSRPYIYQTYKWAESSISNVIRKDIKDEIKKLGVVLK